MNYVCDARNTEYKKCTTPNYEKVFSLFYENVENREDVANIVNQTAIKDATASRFCYSRTLKNEVQSILKVLL